MIALGSESTLWRLDLFVSEIRIQEFRGIKKCEEPLNFADFTVLIGRNNSGKSTVLEALSLLPEPKSHSLRYYQDIRRIHLLHEIHGGASSMVYNYSGKAIIEYAVRNKTWVIEVDDSGNAYLQIKGLQGIDVRSDPIGGVGKALGISRTRIGRELDRMVFFIPNDTSIMNRLAEGLRQEKQKNFVFKTGAHTRVAKELINKCVDDKYTEILFSPELSARKELPNGDIQYIKIRDLGDGIEKVALLVLWIDALKPDLILWDDFEGSAHPSLTRLILEWLRKKTCQIVLSTHSIDVLSILPDVRPRDARVIQLRKTAEDALIHQDLTLEELETLIETNQDPRNLVDLLEL